MPGPSLQSAGPTRRLAFEASFKMPLISLITECENANYNFHLHAVIDRIIDVFSHYLPLRLLSPTDSLLTSRPLISLGVIVNIRDAANADDL